MHDRRLNQFGHSCRSLLGAGLLALATTLSAQAAGVGDDYATERAAFLAARSALAQGDEATFQQQMASLEHYPLHRHLRFLWLEHSLHRGRADVTAISQFVREQPGHYLSRRLMGRWQRLLAKTEDWADFLNAGRLPAAVDMPCMRLRARHALGQVTDYNGEVGKLWVSSSRTKKHCKPVFEALEAKGEPPIELVWQRVYRLMESGQPKAVDPLMPIFNMRDRAWVELWQRGYRKPLPALLDEILATDTPLTRRIIAHLIRRLALQDLPEAHHRWQQLRQQRNFTQTQRDDIDRRLALTAAYRGEPQALAWLDALPKRAHDKRVRAWRVRAALRQQDWPAVVLRLDALTREERTDHQWRYWRARALAGVGKSAEAQALYTALADRTSYYGFLAADRIGRQYSIREESLALDQKLRSQLLSRTDIITAREYYLLDMEVDARRSWNTAIRRLDVPAKLGAAVLADEWGWHDRAVWSVAQTAHRNDYALRFPTPWSDKVGAAAEAHALEAAWIYGVIRRESAYMADVRSHAGAIGLMQLMPATARFVGKRLGQRVKTGALTDVGLNIRLGSYYLNHVRERFGHAVLATAAYNAGPSRVSRWLPETGELPADVWVDTIPFTETRKYVRAVMAYTTVFEWRLSRKVTPLAQRMPAISAPAE